MSSENWKIRNESFPDELQSDYQFLHNQVMQLSYHWLVFKDLYSHSEKRIELLNQSAPNFFRLVEDMLVDRMVLAIARLLDPKETMGKSNATFEHFCKELPDEPIKQDLAQQLKSLRTKFKTFHFQEWRNKAISHSDYKIARQATRLPAIEFSELKECIELVQDWVNHISIEYDGLKGQTAWDMIIEIGGVRELVAALRQSAALTEWERSDWQNRDVVPPGKFHDA